jgi:hypothetical protein
MTIASVSDLRYQLTQSVFQNPITTYRISEEVTDWLVSNHLDLGVKIKTNLIRAALDSIIMPFLKNLNLSDVISLVADYQVRAQSVIPFQPEMLGLSRDNPTYMEIQEALQTIYTHIAAVQSLQDEAHHYVSILKEVTEIYDSLIDIVTAYVTNEDINEMTFKNLAERKRFAENVTADLLVYKKKYYQGRVSVQTLEKSILGPRLNLLLNTISSIRLLCKVDEAEKQVNWGLSRRKTTSLVEEKEYEEGEEGIEYMNRK